MFKKVHIILWLVIFCRVTECNQISGEFQQCSIQCGGKPTTAAAAAATFTNAVVSTGKAGPRGIKGEKGEPGGGCDAVEASLQQELSSLKQKLKGEFT